MPTDDNLDPVFKDLPPLLTPAEVAEVLRMHPQGVYTWLHEGILPAYKLGSTWFIPRDALRATLVAGAPEPRPRKKRTRPSRAKNAGQGTAEEKPAEDDAGGPGPQPGDGPDKG